ncbi:hypothetical protein K5E40_26450 [Pseudomonas baetica]|uniref:hypothetical protein n=1 Tax=Pseudomonas TaxID=286 RepID=UPI001C8C94F5|nr:hypothetical protein [Pseudomonas baetica]MBX9409206.1 hypothetical protein [Pseudomonas baetica]
MSLTVGFSNPAAVTIGGKSAATINALSEASEEAATEALGKDEGDGNQVRTGGAAQEDSKADSSDSLSIAAKMLLKRMQELQKQLQEQQQQLAAAQAASYPTPEAKAQAVMSIQGQVADTNAALAEVSNALVKELEKNPSGGNLVNTTA